MTRDTGLFVIGLLLVLLVGFLACVLVLVLVFEGACADLDLGKEAFPEAINDDDIWKEGRFPAIDNNMPQEDGYSATSSAGNPGITITFDASWMGTGEMYLAEENYIEPPIPNFSAIWPEDPEKDEIDRLMFWNGSIGADVMEWSFFLATHGHNVPVPGTLVTNVTTYEIRMDPFPHLWEVDAI